MHTIRCVAAEWLIVRARLFRTRLGMWLVLLAAAFAWAAPPDALAPLAGRTGLLAGILCVAFAAGSRSDRLALRLSLGHPTSPLALATGRWLGATVAASLAVTGVALAAALRDGAAAPTVVAGWLFGVGTAAAAAAATLPGVLAGGNNSAAVLLAAAALLDAAVLEHPAFIYVAGCCVLGGVAAAASWLARRQ